MTKTAAVLINDADFREKLEKYTVVRAMGLGRARGRDDEADGGALLHWPCLHLVLIQTGDRISAM